MGKYFDSAAVVNELYKECTGKEALDTVDNSNIVDIGAQIMSSWSTDNLYSKIYTKITETIVLNKIYEANSTFKGLYRTGKEYGNIIELLRVKHYEATSDPSFSPQNGATYNDFLTYEAADVEATYIESKTGWQIKHWEPTYQLKEAFTSLESMDKFLGAIGVAVINSINVRLEAMARNALANMIAEVGYSHGVANLANNSYSNCVNLLKLYNEGPNAGGTALTAAQAQNDPEFIRFAITKMLIDRGRISTMSVLYNINEAETHTRPEDIRLTLLNTFSAKAKTYLYADTFHEELISGGLGTTNEVPFWQASGDTDFDDTSISSIDLKIKVPGSDTAQEVAMSGILGVMYDKDAVMVYNESRPAGAFFHPDLQQTRVYNKFAAGFANILASNFIVYYVA